MKWLVLALALLSSCAPGIRPPNGFARMDRAGYDMVATAADGSKVFVSSRTGQEVVPVTFWQEVVARDLQSRGYDRVSKDDAVEIKGMRFTCRVLEFTTSVGDVAYRYLVAVFVNGSDVHTIEFGCEESNYGRHKSPVNDFIRKYADGR